MDKLKQDRRAMDMIKQNRRELDNKKVMKEKKLYLQQSGKKLRDGSRRQEGWESRELCLGLPIKIIIQDLLDQLSRQPTLQQCSVRKDLLSQLPYMGGPEPWHPTLQQ